MTQLAFDFEKDASPPDMGEVRINSLLSLLLDLKRFRLDIEKALCYSSDAYSFDNIVDGVLRGNYHFYPLKNSCVITELVNYPNYKVYHGFIAAGNLEEIREFVHTIGNANAKQLGCKYMTLAGRHGWTREFGRDGWKHTLSTMQREVE